MKKVTSLFLAMISIYGVGITNLSAEPLSETIAQQEVEETGFMGLLVILAARFKIKPEKREEFLELANEAIAHTQEEPGVISYNLYEDPMEPNSFIFFEQWKSRKSLDVHLEAEYTRRLLNRFGELLATEPSTKVYRVQRIDFVLP